MRLLFLLALVASTLAHAAQWRFDSNEGVALDAEVNGVHLVTQLTEDAAIRKEILTQLFFVAGALNERKGGAELGHAAITIQSVTPVVGTKNVDVVYDFKVLVGWHKSFAIPQSWQVALPVSASEAGLKAFYDQFHLTCSEDPEDTDLSPESFYYYFRPQKEGCPLYTNIYAPSVVSYATLRLSPSKLQTTGKFPEYGKVHEDGRVSATMIFGTNHEGANANGDAGIAAYNRTYQSLRTLYGIPDYQSVKLRPKQVPGMAHPDVEMHWGLDSGVTLDVAILMVDKYGLIDPDPNFARRYAERTRTADYVSYSGHSGFGENIRALAKMGTFEKGQYQIFNVNGCDTFFYVDDALRAAHAAVNPEGKPYEFFDVITNSMPSPFNGMAMVAVSTVRALVEKKLTYREILATYPAMQHAIVMGEEDNAWAP